VLEPQVDFSVLGRRLRAFGVSGQLSGWLREFWEYPDRGAPSVDHQVEIHTRNGPGPSNDTWTPVALSLPDRTLPVQQSGGRWRAGTVQSGVQLTPGSGSDLVEIWNWSATPDPALLHLALHVMITECLRASGLVPLHAAVAASEHGSTAWLGATGPRRPMESG